MKKKVLLKRFDRLSKTAFICLLLIFSCYYSFAQPRQISGVVTESNGSPLAGASVKIKGTSTGASTNASGAFKLQVPGNSVLEVSFTGYQTQEVAVGDKATINVVLIQGVSNLNEVVVIGYGTTRRKDLTGSVSSVSAATIEKVPVTSFDQALQGRASGVQIVNNDASPGGNVSVLIRGTGSLATNGNSPLYVIDGYPVETGGINNINPSDIASIDILKDASATAIYGVRAANGVVIVTTKRGKKNTAQVSLDVYNSLQSQPKTYDVLNAQEFATLANYVAANDPAKQFNILPAWSNPSALTNADWQDEVFRNGYTQNYSLAIRGGSDKVQSAASVGYFDQKGIVLASYFKRLSLGLNLDFQPVKWLKSATSAKYSYTTNNNPLGTGSLGVIAQLPPTLDGGNKLTAEIKDSQGNYGFYNPIYTYVAKWYNPVYNVENNVSQGKNQYFLANSSLEATIVDGLKIKTNAGATITSGKGYYYAPQDNRLVNQYGAQAGATQNANFSQSENTSFDWLWENTISYDKSFGKHTIGLLGGISAQEVTFNNFGGSGVPPNSVIKDLSQVQTGTLKLNSTAESVQSLASQFARVNYSFADRYFITGNIRRDGSSKFDSDHKYGVFPSGAVKWRAKSESFLENVDWLADLSFRGSYGEVGNQIPITPFGYQALYSTGSQPSNSGNLGYAFGKIGGSNGTYQAGIASVQPDNPSLKWETDYMTDIGADFAFFKGDLNFTVDWFNRKSKDFLLNISVSPQTGYNTLPQNIGTMSNKGWEFGANYNHLFNQFRFGSTLTLSIIRNKLTSLTSGTNYITNFGGVTLTGQGWQTFTQTFIGQPVGEFYGYRSLGIIQSQAQIDALNAAAVAKGNSFYYLAPTGPGDRLFEDINGDGTVNASDQVSIGSPQPKFYGGLNLDGSFKAWDINLYFYGVYGNKILNYQESNLESFQGRGSVSIENVSKDYYNGAWTPTNPSTTYTRVLYNDDNNQNAVPSDHWIENGSFLKLKNVTVGYTFPASLTKKIAMSRVRVYVSSQNLFTITNYTGLDPEIGLQGGNATQNGVDNGTYPSSRFYTMGLNVTF
ncbi:SusC/RagA family TonB-linked outer membrane protein [Pedobacter sp. HMF7647]|uniref:SusC/RagA family TonB-linked outer membrane protein n=1 Tax=Hufsiella arboris TaxID=2695275 RepID=A0A7K1YB57_9SPHI|nr:TonB-dependent receptor [Hufsiella arboris]MXV51815.1 SusC/RagA family TonB-linked outer membrane protein [Hufsiella arboris]